MSTRVADFEIAAELKNQGAAMEVIGMEDLTIKTHCRRCDSEGPRLIRFVTPDNRPYYLCDTCVAQEDKREMRFSPTWKRSRRCMIKDPDSSIVRQNCQSGNGVRHWKQRSMRADR